VKRLLLSVAVAAMIVVVPIIVYVARDDGQGALLRLTIGRCTPVEHDRYRAACDYIEDSPAVWLIGPIDETDTPFGGTVHRADSSRTLAVRLDSGRYTILIDAAGQATLGTNIPAGSIDMSTGDRDLGTVRPREPWSPEGIPGA
jgi:hypothetical protein